MFKGEKSYFEMDTNLSVVLSANQVHDFTDIFCISKKHPPVYFLEGKITLLSEGYRLLDVEKLRNKSGDIIVDGEVVEAIVLQHDKRFVVVHVEDIQLLKSVRDLEWRDYINQKESYEEE